MFLILIIGNLTEVTRQVIRSVRKKWSTVAAHRSVAMLIYYPIRPLGGWILVAEKPEPSAAPGCGIPKYRRLGLLVPPGPLVYSNLPLALMVA